LETCHSRTRVLKKAGRLKMSRALVDKRSMKRPLLLSVLLTLQANTAWAGERYEFYNGVRMLGMGGAGVAVVNDETSLLVNPAGLGKLRDYFITIADPEIGLGSETQEIAGTAILKVIRPQEALGLNNTHPNKHLHARAQVFPSIVVPNFGFGLFGKYEVNSEVNNQTNQFKYHYTNDWAGVFGFNFRIFNGIIKLGANARITNRVEVRRDDIDPTSTGLSLKTLAKEGLGVGSDGGVLITAPIAWLPTLGAVYRDMGRTSYNVRNGLFMNTSERPDSTPGSLDVALALNPIHGKGIRSVWTLEFQDALTTGDEDRQMRRLHGGVEFNFADAFFLRAGMNQAYWTAGMELSMLSYQFQVASYGEDIGTAAAAREDRRYVVKFSFRF